MSSCVLPVFYPHKPAIKHFLVYISSVLDLNSLWFSTPVLVNLSIYAAIQQSGFYIYSVACCENSTLT